MFLSWGHSTNRWFDVGCSTTRRYLCRAICEPENQSSDSDNENSSSFELLTFVSATSRIAFLMVLVALLYGKNLREIANIQEELDGLHKIDFIEPIVNVT